MGLQLTVPKTANALYADFIDAYWRIDDIIFSNANGESYVTFELNTYPSRESANMSKKPLNDSTFSVGGATAIAYSTCIRSWQAQFKTADVFTNGIPVTEAEQKQVLYALVKSYTQLNFADVLEA